MERSRIDETRMPAPTVLPSELYWSHSGTDGQSMTRHVVLRQLLRLEAMPFDDDASPLEGGAAEEHGPLGRTRKPLHARDVDQLDVACVGSRSSHCWRLIRAGPYLRTL